MDFPPKPNDSDCCNSGCNPCIFDVYEQQLEKYKKRQENLDQEKVFKFENCMCPTSYSVFRLIKREQHTPSSYLYSFKYVKPLHVRENNQIEERTKKLHFEPWEHFLLKAADEYDSSKSFTRAYTPLFRENDVLSFTILVKLYKEGKMSHFLKKMDLEQDTIWRGPYGTFTYNFSCKNILFIAQGTGIAPIFNIIKTMLLDESCESFLKLFYSCTNCGEIFLRNELYNMLSHWNFTYDVFLSNFENYDCKYNEVVHKEKLDFGIIKEFVENHQDVNVVICGSDNFSNCIKKYVLDCIVLESNIQIL